MRCRNGLSVLLAILPTINAFAERPVVPKGTTIQLVDADFELADGAAWDGAGQLFVPDVKRKSLRLYNLRKPDQKPRTLIEGIAISGTAFQHGRLYLSDNQGARIAVLEPPYAKQTPKTLAQFDATERPNDLTVDVQGNVYVTLTRQGAIRKVSPSGGTTDIATGLISPNGIAIAPSGQQLYCSSAKTGKIYRIDLVQPNAPEQAATVLAQLPETADGFRGDGMCVDRAGNIYVTGAKAVHVFSPNGNHIGELSPDHRPINAIIGGNTLKTIYLSTFGGLYAADLNAVGVAPAPRMDGPETNQPESDKHRVDGHSDSPTSTAIGEGIRADLNLVYHRDGERDLLMDVFRPSSQSPSDSDRLLPAIVVVHGGGWQKGDKTKFRALALRLAEKGYATAAIEYRLAGEAYFPAAIRDCNAATAYLRKHASDFGIDPKQIAAVGGSAGGHLVGLMAAGDDNAELKHPAHRNTDTSLSAAVVLAGPLEIASGSVAEKSIENPQSSNAVAWMGGDAEQKNELYRLADAYEQVDKSMPPTLFISGSLDNPARNEKTRSRMKQLGRPTGLVIHEGAKHGHWNRADWIEQVVNDIDQFLKQSQ
ncbi:SMP-30/gluconolactonase/LRE family protein [Stieleria sp. JC731]|uniref:SMP-30/gluconolactonase/LRE family protein n=1 Tax=Pirellulaceae TaxID=2691357 RepID=UPI001E304459|nr:SMP-30/gluconolactonase/LRE family protein [Stieleria sp. JC731]MCC9599754.1 SMP-30/gluconolactonase/LRE family protein [Stieleria sp. JC731]